MVENIRIVELNNKSRKGTHIYIKDKKKRGAYYKYDPAIPIDVYKQYYETRYVKKKKFGSLQQYKKVYKAKLSGQKIKRTRITRSAEQYLRKVRKTPNIQTQLKKGIGHATIANAKTAGNTEIKIASMKMLQGLVLDKGILEILTREENMKKLASRLEYRIHFKDNKNKTLGETGTFGKTPMQVISELKKAVATGEEIKQKQTPTIGNKLQQLKYTKFRPQRDGRINRTEVTLIFRKG